MKRAIIMILTITLAMGMFAACGDPTKTVVATVNGENIYKSETNFIINLGIRNTYDSNASMYSQFGVEYMTFEEFLKEDETISEIKSRALDEYIKWKTAILTATQQKESPLLSEEKISETRQSVEEIFNSMREQIRASVEEEKVENPTINVEKRINYLFNKDMEEYGFTTEEYIEYTIFQEEYSAAREYIAGTAEIKDEEIEKYLNEQIKSQKESYEANPGPISDPVYYFPQGSVYVKHILVKLDDETAEEVQAIEDETEKKKLLETKLPAIKGKADEIYAKTATEDFDKLIDEYGEDPGMQEGSSYKETGYLVYEGANLVPEFIDSSLKLKLNEISEPVASIHGYHIIKCIKIPQALKLNNLTADQKKEIEDALKEVYIDETITKWMEETDIVRYPERVGIKPTPQPTETSSPSQPSATDAPDTSVSPQADSPQQ